MDAPTPVISVKALRRHFEVDKKSKGFINQLCSIFYPKTTTVKALDGVDFTVFKGETIGLLGPNGAGKSTTIKILTGILMPSSGVATVNGIEPHRNRTHNAKKFGVVFGQRTQLWWNLPVRDSFKLLKTIYDIPEATYQRNLSILSKDFEIEGFIDTPVRQLSLGQRMRVEIAASVLHNPDILYLDEPTIGLDIIAKDKIRNFIKKLNEHFGVTILLSTHDLQDVEMLCRRIILINKGVVIYDGELEQMKRHFGKEKTLMIDCEEHIANFNWEGVTKIKEIGTKKYITFAADIISPTQLIEKLSKMVDVKDFALQEIELGAVIKRFY